jgi:hypothetical protein
VFRNLSPPPRRRRVRGAGRRDPSATTWFPTFGCQQDTTTPHASGPRGEVRGGRAAHEVDAICVTQAGADGGRGLVVEDNDAERGSKLNSLDTHARGTVTSESPTDVDYLVIEIRLQGELLPGTDPEPVRRALQDLAARLSLEAGMHCSPDVQLLTPDDPDSVIEYAHLDVGLTLAYHDVLGTMDARTQVERMLSRVRAVRDANASQDLPRLHVANVSATMLHSVEVLEWYGEGMQFVRRIF